VVTNFTEKLATSTPNAEPASSSATLVTTNQTIQYHIPEDNNLIFTAMKTPNVII